MFLVQYFGLLLFGVALSDAAAEGRQKFPFEFFPFGSFPFVVRTENSESAGIEEPSTLIVGDKNLPSMSLNKNQKMLLILLSNPTFAELLVKKPEFLVFLRDNPELAEHFVRNPDVLDKLVESAEIIEMIFNNPELVKLAIRNENATETTSKSSSIEADLSSQEDDNSETATENLPSAENVTESAESVEKLEIISGNVTEMAEIFNATKVSNQTQGSVFDMRLLLGIFPVELHEEFLTGNVTEIAENVTETTQAPTAIPESESKEKLKENDEETPIDIRSLSINLLEPGQALLLVGGNAIALSPVQRVLLANALNRKA